LNLSIANERSVIVDYQLEFSSWCHFWLFAAVSGHLRTILMVMALVDRAEGPTSIFQN
jgi:hypothetical protein